MRLGKNRDDKGVTPEQALEEKVDAMMDMRHNDPVPEKVIKPAEGIQPIDTTPPEIDIFGDTKTAPEVPKELKKGLTVAKQHTEPAEQTVPTTSVETEEQPMAKPVTDTDPLEDPKTDEAVDEITKAEADAVLQHEDEKNKLKHEPTKKSFKQKIKDFFTRWWANKWARWGTITGIILFLVGSVAWPTSRYFLLNTAGVRSSASIKVTDQSTGLPLKNVTVQLGSLQTKTNGDGVAAFRQIKLGRQSLQVERVAFAPVKKNITIGWGSNPLPSVRLKAVGAQYTFMLVDYLSGKPVEGAEIVSGEASAFVDKKGKVVLTLDNPESDTVEATITAKEYRTEKLSFAANTKSTFEMKMVPAKPVVYVTKQSGKYDVYKVDVDGKNKQLLLAGTGIERREISVATSPDGSQAVLVSSRNNKRDENRYLLDTVTLIDTKSGQSKTIDEAQNVRLVDWVGNQLVYVAAYAAPSAGYSQRHRLVTYNTEESARHVVAASDYFNGVASVGGSIYYVVASSDPTQTPGLFKVRLDGSNKQTILNKQVSTMVRTSESEFAIETNEGWYEYTIGNNNAQKGAPPADPYVSKQYFMAPGGGKSIWVDNRDGKGVLLLHEKSSDDKSLVTASGVTVPVVWLNKTTVQYRISTPSETADYVKNIDGGEPKKITDVTATTGLQVNY
jgi:hypothetical protein